MNFRQRQQVGVCVCACMSANRWHSGSDEAHVLCTYVCLSVDQLVKIYIFFHAYNLKISAKSNDMKTNLFPYKCCLSQSTNWLLDSINES